MRKIFYFFVLLVFNDSISYSQSKIEFQSGSSVEVQPGADICADEVITNGNFTGGGTICGASGFILELTVLIEGFYNPATDLMVSDVATVELRNAITPYEPIESYETVLSTFGEGTFHFTNVVNSTNYFIVFRHRNSIETWSFEAKAFSAGILTFDFTPSAANAYGNNMKQVNFSPVRFAVYNGDIDQNGSVDAADISMVDNDSFDFVTGYVNTDVDGNNIVDSRDLAITDNNAFNFVTKITPP